MITINKKPEECANPIDCFQVCFQSDSYLSLDEQIGSMVFTIPAINATAGQTMRLSINGVFHTFTFVTGVPLPPNNIQIGANRNATVENIVQFIASHFVMTYLIDVSVELLFGANWVLMRWNTDDIIQLDFTHPNNIATYGLFVPIQYVAPVVDDTYLFTGMIVKDNALLFSTNDVYLNIEQKGCVNFSPFLKAHLISKLPDFNTAFTLLPEYSSKFEVWLNERNDAGQIYRVGTGEIMAVNSRKPVECGEVMNEFDQAGQTQGGPAYEISVHDHAFIYFVRESGTSANFNIRFSGIFATNLIVNVPSSGDVDVIAININHDFLVAAGAFNPLTSNGCFITVDSGNGYGLNGIAVSYIESQIGAKKKNDHCGTEQFLFKTSKGIFEPIRLSLSSESLSVKKKLYQACLDCAIETRVYHMDISESFEFVSNRIHGRDDVVELLKEFHRSDEIYWIIDGVPVRLADDGGTLKVKRSSMNEFKFTLDSAQIEKY